MAKSPLQAAAAHGHDDHGDHSQPMSMYLRTALMLAILMGFTIFAASPSFPIPMSLWQANVLAVGIAVVKAFIVVWFFMHVKWASNLGKLWAFTGFFFVFTLCVILVDYVFRHNEQVSSWQGTRAESALPRQVGSQDQAPLLPNDVNLQNRIPKANMN